MSENRTQYTVPTGPGGVAGRLGRFIAFLCTAGFMYPNVCVEGMDCTRLQDATQGSLYDKK